MGFKGKAFNILYSTKRRIKFAAIFLLISTSVKQVTLCEDSLQKTFRWDTLHKEGVPPIFENSGFMLFSFVVAFLPYGVGSLLPNLPV